MKTGIVSICCITLFFSVFASQSFGFFLSKHKKVGAQNGEVRLDINTINDGTAHYFVYSDSSRKVKFFIVKSRDGVIRAAFDACDVCFHTKKGYSQQGDSMICNNCGMKFHSDRINVQKGGCNPAPLNREEQGSQLVLQVKDILEGARYF
ncbi:MAG: DUF2318 domain-containing protein [Desulfopila sp.]|jgi:uncharacterized membrane protein|nr:DUF2318 domain-containing protein [Desulfopila sp.]